MHNVMIDIETLSLEDDAVVVSLAAVEFEFGREQTSKELGSRAWTAAFNTQDQIDKRRKVEARTLHWWFNQASDARNSLSEAMILGSRQDNIRLLSGLREFLFQEQKVCLWAKPITFDNVVLRSLYRTYDKNFPVSYDSHGDVSTVKKMIEILGITLPDAVKPEVPHDCLSDAIAQAQTLQRYHLAITAAINVNV